jgi:hypothetical protein
MGLAVTCKAGRNRGLFDIFDKEFIDRHCRSLVVDWWIKVALSPCRCRIKVCNRQFWIVDERNVYHSVVRLSLSANEATIRTFTISVRRRIVHEGGSQECFQSGLLYFLMFFGTCWFLGVSVDCRLCLSMVVVCCQLSVVGCRQSTAYYRF